jgi:hypothetical protein
LLPLSSYGLEPVGNGHAAAGFSALRAPALDAGAAGAIVVSARLAGVAAGFAFFFFPAFVFFLADFFLLPAVLNDFFFFFDDFFFFFFLPPFFAFFFAMLNLLEGC